MRSVFFGFIILLFLFSCGSLENGVGTGNRQGNNTSGQWTIPISQVIDGGPGRDGIPALDNPQRISAASASFMQEPEFVLGYYDGEIAVAYPHQIFDWHEVANDEVNNFPFTITYCPLTGTGIGWDRTVDGKILNFAVSGLIYNNNLIPFDRQTNSNWSQARLDCVNGTLINTKIKTFQLVETRWSTWIAMYPETKVLSLNTGHDRPYGVYPYGDYKTNENNLLFPLDIDDRRLNRKERVHGIIIGETAKTYRFGSFSAKTTLINDVLNEEEVIVIGDASRNFIVSFYRKLEDGRRPVFTAVDENNIILEDDLGNKWDIFGYAVSGPSTGQRLKRTVSFMGYWFAWGVFYPGAEIHEF